MSDDPVRAAPAHPLVLGAAALILVNDFGLQGHAPGWLTGKLSDVGWLVVAPVLIAAIVSWIGLRGRWAKGVGLVLAGGFYVVLQLWPPLGDWFRLGHVADLGDLLVLPALLGAGVAWRFPRARRWRALPALPLLGVVLLADQCPWTNSASWPCGDDMLWEPAEPLRLQLNASWVIADTDGFVRGLRLRDDEGVEVPLVVARLDGSGLAVCAREGLRGDTAYTWEIGPWDGVSSNELTFENEALPTVHFRTLEGAGVPAADATACAALVGELDEDVRDRCDGGGDTGADTGDSGIP